VEVQAILALHPFLDRLLHWQLGKSKLETCSAKLLPLRAAKGADGCGGAGLLRLGGRHGLLFCSGNNWKLEAYQNPIGLI